MSAGHFFVGLGAGIAILALPAMTLTPVNQLPRQFIAWLDGPPSEAPRNASEEAALIRPERGYKPGDPTGQPTPPPTLQPVVTPTLVPARPQSALSQTPSTASAGLRTGVITSDGSPVYVRRAPGARDPSDRQIPAGAAVLVTPAQTVQANGKQWLAVRALNGVAGWVLSTQVQVDGDTPATTPLIAATASATNTANHGTISHTDGVGVVLRNSPNDADRTTSGLMDGTPVTILERSGGAWLHVRADNGRTGWVPAQYVAP